jgi:Ca2+-binding EF-hand superfamily protein
VALHKIKLGLKKMNLEPAALFDGVDKNSDGKLDINEIGLACATFGIADASWVRKIFDTDSDGFISKDEFVSAFDRDHE